jgi:hypothetical protein
MDWYSRPPYRLGPKVFGSFGHARYYCRQLLARTSEGQELTGDDALMFAELIKSYPHYSTTIEPYGVRGFSVKAHCGSKMLVVLLAGKVPYGSHNALFGNYTYVSIDRCFKDRDANHGKRVARQDDVDWVIAA